LSERRVLAAITGEVFGDANGSLKKDAGEVSLEERLVFLDIDKSGTFNSGDLWKRTTGGGFTFDQISEGLYQVRLYDGSSTQLQTTPRTTGATSEPVAVANLSRVEPHGNSVFGFSANNLVRLDLLTNTLTTKPLGATGTDLAVLPDGRALVLLDSNTQPAVIVDLVADTVTAVDLTLQPQETRWTQLELASDGTGVLLANNSAGMVRLFNSSPSPGTSPSTTAAGNPTGVVLSDDAKNAILWHSTAAGIEIQEMNLVTGASVGTATELQGISSLVAFDSISRTAIGRVKNGNLAVLSLADGGSVVHEFAGFSGPADYDRLRQLLVTVDAQANQIVILNTVTFAESLRIAVPATEITQVRLAADGNVAVFVSATAVSTIRLDRPTFANADVRQVDATADVKFGVKLLGDNHPPKAEASLTYETSEDVVFSVGNLFADAKVSDEETEDKLVFLVVSPPQHGIVTVSPAGSMTYAPADNFFGQDSLTVLVHDGRSVSTPIQVALNVLPVIDAVQGIKVEIPAPLPELIVPGANIGKIELLTPDPVGDFNIFVNDPRVVVQGLILVVAADAVFDFENEPLVELRVVAQRISDSNEQVEQTVELTVTDSNEPVTDLLPATASVPEMTFGATVVALQVVDQDATGIYSFSVNDERFEVSQGVLKLRDDQQLNFEDESKIQLAVSVTDQNFNNTITKNILVNVTNVNESPISSSLTAQTVLEKVLGAEIGILSATDFDAGDTHTFTVDDDRFEVVERMLKLKNSVSLNFADEQSILIRVTARDAGGLSAATSFDITVVPNETPFHNTTLPLDVNGDGGIEPGDVLIIINIINGRGPGPLSGPYADGSGFIDVNGDGLVTPIDALLVINHLNNDSGLEPNGEPEPPAEPLIAEKNPANEPAPAPAISPGAGSMVPSLPTPSPNQFAATVNSGATSEDDEEERLQAILSFLNT
jgi:antitoxin (DNA-binding transcriptional repressor) of toxin-antitoxin stability system